MLPNLPTEEYTLVIGPTAAGKTCILWRIRFGEFLGDPRPTPGLSDPFKIGAGYIYELGGHQSFQVLLEPLKENASFIVFVIDITKDQDFEEYQNFIKKYPNENLILAANKIDKLDPSRDDQELQDEENAYPKFQNLRHNVILCSAKNGNGIWKLREIINQESEKARTKQKRSRIDDSKLKYSEEEIEEARSEARKILEKYQNKAFFRKP
ncbi:MAG: GTPase domain-containing protein [Candidatus Hodarchaeota archaeon]